MTLARSINVVLALAAAAGIACAGEGIGMMPQNGGPGPPTLSGDVQPIFSGVCAVPGCHAGTTPREGMNLSDGSAHSNTVNVPANQLATMMRVRPGQPEQSYLVHKIQGTQASVGGTGNRMPLGGTPLTQAQIDTIRDWITAGAPDN